MILLVKKVDYYCNILSTTVPQWLLMLLIKPMHVKKNAIINAHGPAQYFNVSS